MVTIGPKSIFKTTDYIASKLGSNAHGGNNIAEMKQIILGDASAVPNFSIEQLLEMHSRGSRTVQIGNTRYEIGGLITGKMNQNSISDVVKAGRKGIKEEYFEGLINDYVRRHPEEGYFRVRLGKFGTDDIVYIGRRMKITGKGAFLSRESTGTEKAKEVITSKKPPVPPTPPSAAGEVINPKPPKASTGTVLPNNRHSKSQITQQSTGGAASMHTNTALPQNCQEMINAMFPNAPEKADLAKNVAEEVLRHNPNATLAEIIKAIRELVC